MDKSELAIFKSRWRRWLGNKTRRDKPYWTTLLNANWLGWVDGVFSDRGFGYHGINWQSKPDEIKSVYARAIDNATMRDLQKLDALYAENRWLHH